MSTKAKSVTDNRTLEERYYDARTLQGLAEAERGEGISVEEARVRMDKHIKSLRK